MPVERVDSIYDIAALEQEHTKYMSFLKESKDAIIDLNKQRVTVKNADLGSFTQATADLNKTIETSNVAIQKTTKVHEGLSTAVGAGIKATAQMNEAQKAVISLVNQRFATEAKLITSQTDYAKAIASNRLELGKQNAELKTQAQLDAANSGSIERARAAVKALSSERDKLNLFTEEGRKRQEQLNAQIDKHNSFIKKNVDNLAAQKINVGNYSGAISVLKTSLDEVVRKMDAQNKAGKGNSDIMKSLEKEYTILNQLVNSQSAGFANAAMEIRENQKALLQMSQAGLSGTDAFNKLALATGVLKDDIADLRTRTKTLGSDTFAFDGLIQGAQTLAGAYGVVQGASALVGSENEDLQKTLTKLAAVMTVMQGLQSVANGLQKESAFVLFLQSARTKALAALETLRNFALKGTVTAQTQSNVSEKEGIAVKQADALVTGEVAVATTAASIAMRVFRTALIATGIGAVLVLLASAASAMSSFGGSTADAATDVDTLTAALERQKAALENQFDDLNIQIETTAAKMKIAGKSEDEITKTTIGLLKEKSEAAADFSQQQFSGLQKLLDKQNELNKAIASLPETKDFVGGLKSKLTDDLAELNKSIEVQDKAFRESASGSAKAFNAVQKAELDAAVKTAEDKLKAKEKHLKDESGLLNDYLKKDQEQINLMGKKDLELSRDIYAEQFADQERSENDRLESLQGFYLASSKLVALDEKGKLDSLKVQTDIDLKKASEITNAALRFKTIETITKTSNDTQTNIKSDAQKAQSDLDLKFSKTTIDIVHDGFVKEEKELTDHIEKLKFLNESKIDTAGNQIDIRSNTEQFATINELQLQIQQSQGARRERLEKELQDRLTEIENKAALDRLAIQENELQVKLSSLQSSGILDVAEITKTQADITANELAQSKIRTDNAKKESAEKERVRNEELEKIHEYESASLDLYQTFADATFTNDKNRIQEQIDLNDEKTKRDIDAVNASTRSEQDKAAAITIIQAKAQAEKEALQARQRKADYEKAKFDKQIAILQIIAQIAIDIAEAKYGAAALAGIALIKLIATPIPKYKHGRGEGKEEIAAVGEGGVHEYIHRADGTIEKTPAVETITHLMPKDKVYPSKQAMMKELALSALPLSNYHVNKEGGIDKKDIQNLAGRIEDAIGDIKIHTQMITKDGWRNHNERLANYDAWVNKYIKN